MASAVVCTLNVLYQCANTLSQLIHIPFRYICLFSRLFLLFFFLNLILFFLLPHARNPPPDLSFPTREAAPSAVSLSPLPSNRLPLSVVRSVATGSVGVELDPSRPRRCQPLTCSDAPVLLPLPLGFRRQICSCLLLLSTPVKSVQPDSLVVVEVVHAVVEVQLRNGSIQTRASLHLALHLAGILDFWIEVLEGVELLSNRLKTNLGKVLVSLEVANVVPLTYETQDLPPVLSRLHNFGISNFAITFFV